MRYMWQWFIQSLGKNWFLWTLIIINFLGSIYGFYWYKEQLASTHPAYLRIFVPDSPTSSSLFTIYLMLLLVGRTFPALEAFASVTNFKYGVWAVAVIIAGGIAGNELRFTDYMLMVSHGGMALESLLYTRFYSIRLVHMIPVALWTLGNDVLDYSLHINPWLPQVLEPNVNTIGWLTGALSLFSLLLVYLLVGRFRRKKLV